MQHRVGMVLLPSLLQPEKHLPTKDKEDLPRRGV